MAVAAEIHAAMVRVQAADQLDAALAKERDGRPVAEQPVADNNVPGAEHVPQSAEQADFALPLAGILAESKVHDRPGRQGE